MRSMQGIPRTWGAAGELGWGACFDGRDAVRLAGRRGRGGGGGGGAQPRAASTISAGNSPNGKAVISAAHTNFRVMGSSSKPQHRGLCIGSSTTYDSRLLCVMFASRSLHLRHSSP